MKKLLALIILSLATAVFAQATDTQDIIVDNGAIDAITAPADVTLTLTANNTWDTGAAGTLEYTNALGGADDILISAAIPDPTLTLELNVTGPTAGTLAIAGFTVVDGTAQAFITGIPGGTFNASANVTARVQTNNIGALPATNTITVTYDMN